MRMSNIAVETGNDDPDNWYFEIGARQIDSHDPGHSRRSQAVQFPVEVQAQIIGRECRYIAKRMRLAVLAQRVEQCVNDIGMPRLFVFRGQQIVPDASDISHTGLCRLAQCPDQCD